jgi:hypothetical protein
MDKRSTSIKNTKTVPQQRLEWNHAVDIQDKPFHGH